MNQQFRHQLEVRHDCTHHRCRAFTIVEFVVACIIVSVAMLGIHRTFHDLMKAEMNDGLRGNEQANAMAVLDHLERVLKSTVNVSVKMGDVEMQSVVAGDDVEPGCKVLTCWSYGTGFQPQKPQSVAMQRVRYRWSMQGHTDVLDVRKMDWAGSQIIDSHNLEELAETEAWSVLPVDVVATGIKQLSVDFKVLGDPDATWKNKWKGNVGKVAVRLIIKIGSTQLERIVIPSASVNSVEGGGT
jgi:type II secretory pathway component PulJ